MSLKGKIGIVTGAKSGIGKAIALALAKAGAEVVVAELDQRGITGRCHEPWLDRSLD